LVEERAHQDEQAGVVQGLQTRREELREVVQSAERLTQVLGLLKSQGISLLLSHMALTQLATKTAALKRAFSDDPQSLAKPRAFDRTEYQRLLTTVRDALFAAWQKHIGPPDGDGLAGVLERYEPLKRDAAKLREIQQGLSSLARSLPRSEQEFKQVRKLKDQAAAVVRGLSLDANIIDFLTRAQTTGYPLQEVIDDAALLQQLKRTGLLTCLKIVTA
jgi:hypothetical protein